MVARGAHGPHPRSPEPLLAGSHRNDDRNRQLLVGEEVDLRIRAAAIRAVLDISEIARVSYLRLEIVRPRMISAIGDVDLVGDDTESHVAVRLRALGARIGGSRVVAGALLSLSAPDEPSPAV